MEQRTPRCSARTPEATRTGAAATDGKPPGGPWQALLEQAHLAVLGLDAEERVVYASPLLVHLTGYGADEMLGRNWFDQFASTNTGPRSNVSCRRRR